MTYIIGIAGASGSGKTEMASKIKNNLSEKLNVNIIPYDNYYKDQEELSMDQRIAVNYDHPKAFDKELLLKDIKQLKEDKAVTIPTYDFKTLTRSKKSLEIKPVDVIIVEGILVLEFEQLLQYLDLKIYVELDIDECLIRRINRDMLERERKFKSITNQYLKTVKPMYLKYILPSKNNANIIIPGEENDFAIKLISDSLYKEAIRRKK